MIIILGSLDNINWGGGLYYMTNLLSMRIFTLIMNKIFI